MGLMDDFNVDMDEIKSNSWDVADGTYDFEISEAYRQAGSKNNPDTIFAVIKYDLDEAGTYSEWTGIGNEVDGQVVPDLKGLARLKTRLLSLGIPAGELNDLELEDLEGITGTFTLQTTKSKKNGKEYQNVRNVRVSKDEEEAAPAAAEPSDAERKARVQAKQAERAAAPAAKREPRASAKATPAAAEDANPFDV